jgi:hypothetical protein
VVTNCLVQSNRCDQAGAGIACAWGGIVDRCRMFGNVAESSGSGLGGGVDLASGGWVRNSLIAGNTAKYRGGGVSLRYKGTVENCTITTNRTYDNSSGGGAGGLHCDWSGAKLVRNCIIWNNDSSNNMPNWGTNYNTTGSVFEYCCTHPTNGLMGNVACFDADPLFVDGNARNFRTGYGSPCIDAGTNSVDGASIDLDGVLRPLDGNFDSVAQYDVGAYEYTPASADTDNDGMPDAWELGYGLNPTNAADATANPDGDPHNNLEEYFADTSPTNALSFLRIVALADLPPWTVYYEPSSTNRFYTLLYSTNLATANWTPLAGRVRVPGQGGVRTLTDTNLDRVRFYRVMAGP